MILPATIKGKPMDPAASSTKATHVKHLKYVIWKFVVSQNARTRKYHGEMSILSSSKQPASVFFQGLNPNASSFNKHFTVASHHGETPVKPG